MTTGYRTALVLLLAAHAPVVHAQGTRPQPDATLLGAAARLDVQDVSLEAAIQQLARQSGVPFAFSPDVLRVVGPVSCSCTNTTVARALETLLAGTGLVYREDARRVVLSPRSAPPDTLARGHVPQSGTLVGRVSAAPDSQPVYGAQVRVSDQLGVARTDATGWFALTLPAGTYEVFVQALAYTPQRLHAIRIGHGDTTYIAVQLDPAPIRLGELVVTPGTYGVLRETSVYAQQTLTPDYVHALPRFADDIYRAIDRLPGVTTHDITAKITVRGAPNDQVLVQLDGLDLSEPFHLKDWDGSLSIIDVESVGDMQLMTGGFTAEYGDRMAGVLAMHTTTPPPNRTRTTLGVSVMNLTGKSEGGFARGRGTWLASARYGFLGPTLKILHEANGAEPTYYDVFGKVQYQLGRRHLISGHVLHAADDFAVLEEDGTDVHSEWKSSYVWSNWIADFTHRLSALTTVSAGRVTRRRGGVDYLDVPPPSPVGTRVEDHGAFTFVGLKQQWAFVGSDRVFLRWGFELRHGSADYDYYRRTVDWVPNTTDPAAPAWVQRTEQSRTIAAPSGQRAALFQSTRLRLTSRVTTEIGLRYDHHSHTGDNTLSPRVNLAIEAAPRTMLRVAWGHYYQAHGLDELYVADGDDRFYPTQRAEHRVVGLEHRLRDGTSLRIEVYERRVTDPRPEYRSLIPVIEALWEENLGDRIRVAPTRGRARGIEFSARRDVGARFAWSASYALARADDEIGGAWVPRPCDQRHTLRLELAYRPTPSWSLSYAWQFHSGWPGTREDFQLMTTVDGSRFLSSTFGPLHGERLPAYHRLDLRVAKLFPVGRGRLELYFDVFNAYNRANAEALNWDARLTPDGNVVSEPVINPLLRVFPTFGARWEF